VLANLGYFTWYQFSPVQKPAEVVPSSVPPGANRLVLLAEKAVSEPPVRAPQVEEVKDVAQVVEQLAAATVQKKATDERESAFESSGGAATRSEEGESERVSVASVIAERVCHSVGPLSDSADTSLISKQLSQHGFQIAMRSDKLREPAGYWVYMPAMPAAKARRIVADLDAQGMKDYFIGRKSHISLGIFSTEEKARKRQQRVKQLGYDAELGQRYRSSAVYWLDVEERELNLPVSQVWDEVRKLHPDIRIEPLNCADLGR
jgi:hypothetical protein